MAQPKYRLSISNRDKSERTFKDYKGDERTSRYQTIGAIFENEDGRLSVAIDRDFKFKASEEWFNIFEVTPRADDEDDAPKPKKGATKVKKTKKPAPPADDESDDSDPFED